MHDRHEHTNGITDLTVSPDKTQLVTASQDKTVRFWSAVDGTYQGQVAAGGLVFAVCYSPDGNSVATGLQADNTSPHGMAIMDAKNFQLIGKEPGTFHFVSLLV